VPFPHKKVVFVGVAKLDPKLMQSPQGLPAALEISWPRGPRILYPLSNKSNHAPVFPFGKMAEKPGADTPVTDAFIGNRLGLHGSDFPRLNGKFDKNGLVVIKFGVC
jgi:hypothetical protein